MKNVFPGSLVSGATFAVIALPLVLGCGDSGPKADIETTVTASGTVTFEDAPLEFYQVTFQPEGHRVASGVSDAAGKFVLGTNKQGDGAVAGSHKVSVVYVGPPNTDPNAGMNDFKPPPPPKVKIPAKYHRPETSGITIEVPAGGSSDLHVDLKK
jgi:hypothetical protein